MPPTTRGASRHQPSSPTASGSEYHESNASAPAEDEPKVPEEEEEEPVEFGVSQRGRRVQRKSYKESASEDDPIDIIPKKGKRQLVPDDEDEDEEEEASSRYALRTRSNRRRPDILPDFIASDDEDGEPRAGRYPTRNRNKSAANGQTNGGRITRRSNGRSQPKASSSRATRSSRRTRSSANNEEDEDGYVDEPSSGSADGEGSLDEAPVTSPEPAMDVDVDADADGEGDGDGDGEPETDGKPYSLRQRAKINYAIPPPIEEMRAPPKPRTGGMKSHSRSNRPKAPGWSATGAELSRWMGAPADDSDSDNPTRTPRKQGGGLGGTAGNMFAGGVGTGGFLPGDLAAAAGTPSNLGKVNDAALADADPLGVNQNVTFDEVGGLDDHINSLKEMTLLPLLYPEVFQRFNLTPPRGVLFHGPPGTGKTLLARALAASCRSNGKGISFFMRKGADCLSKWVGEAERQLRLLFEEARNQQPSIIFFDEIDGLAPVRSSKQDQIHASIVSTLLALMDGMDGRGQVVVIGATNRPDAVDPALRRPGRFDREFYFPLPGLDAREKIVRIMTQKWAGWDGEKGVENAKGLAKLTKGYGGADMRALCTEAALNAVQRRYPQIYKSNDRLLLKPETIEVELRDFMIAIKKLVPSSARSVSSAASPLPTQLEAILREPLEKMKEVISKVLPTSKKRTALEEAEWEDEGSEGALEREVMMQSMETLRIYRPRVVLHGPVGMGHGYVAAAALHHLEGYHIQSLDLGSLLSDATRSPEAAIVQLFVEAKRHQPSVVYIPSLIGWCSAVTETARTTVRAMLDTLAPTDPVLLLAVVDGAFTDLPRDVRQWFGSTRENRVALVAPTASQREVFFEGLMQDVRRPPNHFPDGIQRKKRVLEVLPIAPPLEPRQPSQQELAVQEAADQRVVTLLKYRLGPILSELKRKFKRFTKRAAEEYNYDFSAPPPPQIHVISTAVQVHTGPNGVAEVVNETRMEDVVEIVPEEPQMQVQEQLVQDPPLFDMDLERMNVELYKGRYLTPEDLLDDIRKIVHNAGVRHNEDPERLFRAQAMLTAAEVSVQDFDPQFRMECQRMAARERKRREDFRKEKEKGRAEQEEQQAAANGTYAPGTRRSARNNGKEPEMGIQDVGMLERKLKRQRSNGAEATPSEDENGERVSKKVRTDGEGSVDGERTQPADAPLSPAANGGRSSVRFADEVQLAPTSSSPKLNGIPEDQEQPSSEPEPRTGGFDPALLNPASPVTDLQHGMPTDPPDNPFSVYARQATEQPEQQPSSDPQPSEPHPAPDSDQLMDTQATEPVESQPEQPMEVEVEREPTPLPDFYLDEAALQGLKTYLRDATASLNVEQLEQLRATCLGLVWRHRQDWDREVLLRELKAEAQTFVEEVALDDMDASSP
ncbi:AAA-domain-containing protein [Epithele typhae]|uniref:AAA-domain-containing protein n=1 Tax=Epithele typhae TaxID=378194 RepID=UPI0020078A3A|nr:AAA-domain-containing protein [Epithele typhae]KAH9941140.1 AAA-domain-containing protein [Epithele typhae]